MDATPVNTLVITATGTSAWFPAPAGGLYSIVTGTGTGALAATIVLEGTNDPNPVGASPTVVTLDTLGYSSTGNGSLSQASPIQTAYYRVNCTVFTGAFTQLKIDTSEGVSGSSGGGGGGDASAANQTVVQAFPGANATKAMAVQGVTNGKPVTTTLSSPNGVAAGLFAQLTAYGRLRTSQEPNAVFNDAFETDDTTNRWVNFISGGTAVVSAGALTLSASTTTAAYAARYTAPSFTCRGLNYLAFGTALKIPASTIAQTGRWWGIGSVAGAPTYTAAIQDGYMFYLDGAGSLFAKVYAAGVEVGSTDITSSKPADNTYTRYLIVERADSVFFYVTGTEVPVAFFNFLNAAVEKLPISYITVAGTTPASAPTLVVQQAGVADTGNNSISITDSTYAWRGATVKPANQAPTASDTALVVSVSPNSNSDLTLATATLTTTGPSGTVWDTAGRSTLTLQVGGIWNGSIGLEVSNDLSATSWEPIFFLPNNEPSVVDQMVDNGMYAVTCGARYVRPNAKAMVGTATLVPFAKTESSVSAVDMLSLAMDKANNTPLNVEVVKQPANPSTPVADVVATGVLFLQNTIGNALPANAGSFVSVALGGHTTVAVHLLTNTLSSAITIQHSTDGLVWVTAQTCLNVNASTWAGSTIAAATTGTFLVPVVGTGFFRVVCQSAVTGSASVVLRATVAPMQSVWQNLMWINSTAVVTAGVAGMLAVGGNIAPGVAPTANPVLTAGIDGGGLTRSIKTNTSGQVVIDGIVGQGIAATGNPLLMGGVDSATLTRRLLTDTSGRLQTQLSTATTDTAATTRPVGGAFAGGGLTALLTSDSSAHEGVTQVQLLAAVVQELQILNYQIFNLPQLLNAGLPATDEPGQLRNDPSFLQLS